MFRTRHLALFSALGLAAAVSAVGPGGEARAQLFPPWSQSQSQDQIPAPQGSRGENFSAGKTPAQLFASDCTGSGCHRGPQGLGKGRSAGSLAGFLREHYTNSRESATALAAYLAGIGGEAKPAPQQRPPRAAARPEPAARPDSARPEPGAKPEAPPPPARRPPPSAPDAAKPDPKAKPPQRAAQPPPAAPPQASPPPAPPAAAAPAAAPPAPTPPEPAPVAEPPPPAKPEFDIFD